MHIYRLGAPHDGDDSLSYIGGPGAKKCNWNDGYLMSSLRHDTKGLHWSSCSKEAMSYFLKLVNSKYKKIILHLSLL